jgi:starch synthase
MRALHVVSELDPLTEGAIGEVAGGLTRGLDRLGVEVTVVLPRYPDLDPERWGIARRLRPLQLRTPHGVEEVTLHEGRLPASNVRLFLVEHGGAFPGPDGRGDPAGHYGDEPARFALLGRAAIEIARHPGRWPDVVHAHDWRGSLALLFARRAADAEHARPATVASVHQIRELGLVGAARLEALGLTDELAALPQIDGAISLLQAGLALADRIAVPSPQYARELQTDEAGGELSALFASASRRTRGILNGIDEARWNPARDTMIPAPFSPADPAGKARCKEELQRELGLPRRPRSPVVAVIGALADDGPGDELVQLGDELAAGDTQLVIHGTGARPVEERLRALAARHPTRIATRIGDDEPLAHRIAAGSDFTLLPPRFDPSGPPPLHCMRYGSIPIAPRVGAYVDAVVDFDERTGTGTAIAYPPEDGVVPAIRRAARAFRAATFPAVVDRAMRLDLSWKTAARRYREVYDEIAGPRSGAAV